jgi:tetratricopeptide (TPR) repeat protein
MLQGVGPSVALGRDTTMLREILDKTAGRVDEDLTNQPETAIELRTTLAASYGELGLFDKMEEMARKNLELARSTLGEENTAVANALSYREAQTIRKRLSANPRGPLLMALAGVLRKQGHLSEAEAIVRDATKAFPAQVDAEEIACQNAFAWLLATYPDPDVRNGRSAVTYAEKAVTATGRTNAMYLDTLAAAYAEAGDFAKAIRAQNEAIALNKNEALNAELATRLKLYESGSPYRDRE